MNAPRPEGVPILIATAVNSGRHPCTVTATWIETASGLHPFGNPLALEISRSLPTEVAGHAHLPFGYDLYHLRRHFGQHSSGTIMIRAAFRLPVGGVKRSPPFPLDLG